MSIDYRTLLDTTIGVEPPTSLDVDELTAASRRRLHRHRWAVGTVGVAVLAIASATAIAFAAPARPVLGPATPTPPVTPEPTLAGIAPAEDPTAAAARLAAAMRSVVTDVVPGVHLGGEFDVRHYDVDARLLSDGAWFAPAYVFQGQQVIDAGGRHGVITISVMRRLLADECPAVTPPESGYTCEQSAGPNGELIAAEQYVSSDDTRQTAVKVDRADGSAVWVISTNYVDLGWQSPVTGADPPLTVAQLTAIALDSRLTLYP
jgi:hypothetical protein